MTGISNHSSRGSPPAGVSGEPAGLGSWLWLGIGQPFPGSPGLEDTARQQVDKPKEMTWRISEGERERERTDVNYGLDYFAAAA